MKITLTASAAALAAALTVAFAPPGALAQSQGQTQWNAGERTVAQRTETYSTADIQRALSAAGYNAGPVDGIMGPSTRSAIQAFQRDNNLSVTGSPNSALYRALERQGYLTARMASPPAIDDEGARVREIERGLARAGYDPGAVDGRMNWETRSAIRALQRDAGLRATGEMNDATLSALRDRAGRLADEPRTTAGDTVNPALVEDVQLALRQRGYDSVSVTGELDARTRSAIRDVQREMNLPPTGQPSAELLALIESPQEEEPAPTRTADAVVEQIEIALANKGYDVGPINEAVEPATADAIRTYQQQRGLPVDGQPTEQLLADIRQSDVQAPEAEPQQAEDPAQELFRRLGERALREIQER
ncbi:peptidoglycan-binding protein [Caenispirillum salinarum]|uniref:peptidoglycan-binding domain-containing protein n=1 Tax=Caenispirillum salinarum TaxID=859058 RepID=UPI00384E5611